MADRADAADPRHQRRHLVKRPPFAQLLKAAKLGDVKAGFLDPAVFVQVKRDLGMAFDARNRIDDDTAALLHEVSLVGFWLLALGFWLLASSSSAISRTRGYDPNRVFELTSGCRPSSNSDTT